MKKWSKEELSEHIKLNLNNSYSAAVVVSALYKTIYGTLPKIGLSGAQAEFVEQLILKLPEA